MDITLNPSPGLVQIGTESIEAEELIAYELGYRVKPKKNIKLDLALFFNDYDDLRSFEVDMNTGQAPLANKGFAESYGVELGNDDVVLNHVDDYEHRERYM